jgi:hypothetical protein
MREARGDLRLGHKPEQVVGVLARAGFQGLRTQALVDRYRVAVPNGAPNGGAADFAMFAVRGHKPAAVRRS